MFKSTNDFPFHKLVNSGNVRVNCRIPRKEFFKCPFGRKPLVTKYLLKYSFFVVLKETFMKEK